MSCPESKLAGPPTDDPVYRPGVCNIGVAEIGRRRRAAAVAVVVTAGFAIALLGLGVQREVRWLLVAPLAGTIVAVLQAWLRFCVAYGLRGVQNFGALGDARRVIGTPARKADRRAALLRITASVVLATLVAGLFVSAPF